MKAKIAVATIPGTMSGRTTRRKAPRACAPVDDRGLLDVLRDGVDGAAQHPDREGQVEGGVGADEPDELVQLVDALEGEVERDDHRRLGDRLDDEEDDEEELAPLEGEAGEGEGGEEADHERERDGDDRDDRRVRDVVQKKGRPIVSAKPAKVEWIGEKSGVRVRGCRRVA